MSTSVATAAAVLRAGVIEPSPGLKFYLNAYNPRVIPPGTILDNRYEILGLIAEGRMGAVYRARRTRLGDAAVKVVRPADDSARCASGFCAKAGPPRAFIIPTSSRFSTTASTARAGRSW